MNVGKVAAHWSMPDCGHGQEAVAGADVPTPSMLSIAATTVALAEAATAAAVMVVRTRRRARLLYPSLGL